MPGKATSSCCSQAARLLVEDGEFGVVNSGGEVNGAADGTRTRDPRRDRPVYLGSTHWPWIGERTRQVDGAHVALLAEVLNPVACKVGPEIGRDQLLALCERLDPRREPGRLTLIARMGAQKVGERPAACFGNGSGAIGCSRA